MAGTKTSQEIREEKERLYAGLAAGRLTLEQSTRRMRRIVGVTQERLRRKSLENLPRVLREIERGWGNPTLETLNKIARPFGLKVAFKWGSDLLRDCRPSAHLLSHPPVFLDQALNIMPEQCIILTQVLDLICKFRNFYTKLNGKK